MVGGVVSVSSGVSLFVVGGVMVRASVAVGASLRGTHLFVPSAGVSMVSVSSVRCVVMVCG